jgi:hypothetical protein
MSKGTLTLKSPDVEVEMTNKNSKGGSLEQVPTPRRHQYRFCSHVGYGGALIMFSMVFLSAIFFYLEYQYSHYFQRTDKVYFGVFIFIGCMCIVPPLYRLVFWKAIVANTAENIEKGDTSERKTCVAKVNGLYKDVQIDGKFFLFVLYIQETLESANQIVNFRTIYLCSLPLSMSSPMCIILGIDAVHSATSIFRKNTIATRNRQVMIDTFMDCFCTGFPICIMFYWFVIPIDHTEMLLMTTIPGLSLLLKLDNIFEEILRARSAHMLKKKQTLRASFSSRRRLSMFEEIDHYKLAETQQALVPKTLRVSVGVLKCTTGLFFLVMAMIHMIGIGALSCKEEVWGSCQLKVPYCRNLFTPKCDCAVLRAKNHNWTALPKQLNSMNSLRIMEICHGPLEKLPSNFDSNFPILSVLKLPQNELRNIPSSIGTMKLHVLHLQNNNLTALPSPIWGNEHVLELEVGNNNISEIPTTVQNAKMLTNLVVSNNSLSAVPKELFLVNGLLSLKLDGNYITSIPNEIENLKHLQIIDAQNNRIASVSKEIEKLSRLDTLDIRNNILDSIPAELSNLRSLIYIYLHGNPICSNGWLPKAPNSLQELVKNSPGAGCNKQCSMFCKDVYTNDGMCDPECNSLSCTFDRGDCERK